MAEKKSSIVDIPREAGQDDLLGLDNYAKALAKFVESAGTPLTVAIQGEWGSGKTSMMNQLRDVLCEGDDARFYGIWLNTWQYALLSDEELILSRIVTGLTDETISAIQQVQPNRFNENIAKVKDVSKAIFKSIIKTGAQRVAGDIGTGIVDTVLGDETKALTVNDLRDNLSALIAESVAEVEGKEGFIFFIDDLDRIEPVYAVQILELLKNIFNISHCLFILAIDYDVVVKGLEPKFGPLTENNEREFRSFFDKIIQLPFSMPVGRYEIDGFIVHILDDVGYLTPAEVANDEFRKTLSRLAEFSVGRNPRSLKRLTNSLSLIKIFNTLETASEKRNDEPYEKIMNIGLICCQIAYPFIYRLMNGEPDFKAWNEGTASRMRLAPLEEDEKERLAQAEEFDEEWEQVVYRACQRDLFLSKNANRVSALLNLIAEQLPEGKDLGSVVGSLLSLSSVTSVESNNAGNLVDLSTRSKFGDIEAFIRQLDPGNKMQEYCALIKLIHEDVRHAYPDAQVSYAMERITFGNPDFPRRKKSFLVIGTWGQFPIKVRVEKESVEEKIPVGASQHWYTKEKDLYFNFQLNSVSDYTQQVKDYIRRSYDLGMKGLSLRR